jgi:NTP pyrophosphatase (non-canonical NTP hydrolase)
MPTDAEVGAFVRRNFDSMSPLERGLLLAEETGELCRALLKRHQRIRGSYEDWSGEVRKEAADVAIGLLALAYLEGFSLENAVAERWRHVSARDFVRDPIAHGMPTDE